MKNGQYFNFRDICYRNLWDTGYLVKKLQGNGILRPPLMKPQQVVMALTNLTEVPKKTSHEELACSTEFTRGVHTHLIVLLALNGFVSITAFLGNTLQHS